MKKLILSSILLIVGCDIFQNEEENNSIKWAIKQDIKEKSLSKNINQPLRIFGLIGLLTLKY